MLINSEVMKEIESLGLHATLQKKSESMAFVKIKARSNLRALLIPIDNRYVTSSGLALFQPLLKKAAFIKTIALIFSYLGMAQVYARNKLYMNGSCTLSKYFPEIESPSYAFFTGTDSPHRKMAIQIMSDRGKIVGFAKIGQSKSVSALLVHEANMLREVAKLRFKSAIFPNVLFIGPQNEATMLVTDTLKTALTKSPRNMGVAHYNFLKEMGDKTRRPERTVDELVIQMAPDILKVEELLSSEWRDRIEKVILYLQSNSHI